MTDITISPDARKAAEVIFEPHEIAEINLLRAAFYECPELRASFPFGLLPVGRLILPLLEAPEGRIAERMEASDE